MNQILRGIVFTLMFINTGCTKESSTVQIIPIPNGDFEDWAGGPGMLSKWETNSCPVCTQPIETNIIRIDTVAYSGKYAAKFIYNNRYAAWAENRFLIPAHPTYFIGYVKSKLVTADTVSIAIKLYNNGILIDSGKWIGTSSITNYTQIKVALTQNNPNADSVFIRIQGGNKIAFPFPSTNTEFWVDNFSFEKL